MLKMKYLAFCFSTKQLPRRHDKRCVAQDVYKKPLRRDASSVDASLRSGVLVEYLGIEEISLLFALDEKLAGADRDGVDDPIAP